MEIYSNISKKHAIIKIEGKFNIDHIERFDHLLSDVFDNNPEMVAIDLHDVEYIDSSALGSLIKAMNVAKKHSQPFYLYNLQDNIQDVFRLSYLDKFFTIKTSQEMIEMFPEIKSKFE